MERMTSFAGMVPARGTYPIAANVLIEKGHIVCLDANGRAVPGAASGALKCVGKASATYDNLGGPAAAKDLDVEVEFGVFGYAGPTLNDTHVPRVVFVASSTSVALTGTVVAGVLTERREGQAWTWMGPHVTALAAFVPA